MRRRNITTTIWIGSLLGLAALLGPTPAARAGDEWHKITDVQAGGDAKEIAVDRDLSRLRFYCLEGSIDLTTVWVREGEQKTQHKVASHFEKGQWHVIDLGGRKRVTGLRISDGGNGKYRVQYQ